MNSNSLRYLSPVIPSFLSYFTGTYEPPKLGFSLCRSCVLACIGEIPKLSFTLECLTQFLETRVLLDFRLCLTHPLMDSTLSPWALMQNLKSRDLSALSINALL